jgi:SAM-dependent methyltransferase
MAVVGKVAERRIAMTERRCPVCLDDKRHAMHTLTLTFGGEQTIFSCDSCGMVYASAGKPVDYDSASIYALPSALGSGVSANDQKRLRALAATIGELFADRSISILDVGCAQGGLLHELRELGFSRVTGMDPSHSCVERVGQRGMWAYQGMLSDPPKEQYDLVILSHVLEHVENVRGALLGIRHRMTTSGKVYVEVPDAYRYADYDVPFLDFNSEHVNHFTSIHLMRALWTCGLNPYSGVNRKTIGLPQLSEYPAMWTVAERATLFPRHMDNYIAKSKTELCYVNEYLEEQLKGFDEVAVWGVNSYCANITSLPIFQKVRIVQAVDRNPALHGRMASCGVRVESTDNVRTDIAIVITAVLSVDSILADIAFRELPNKIISVGKKVYA